MSTLQGFTLFAAVAYALIRIDGLQTRLHALELARRAVLQREEGVTAPTSAGA